MQNNINDNSVNLKTSDQVYILSLDILGFSKLVEKNRHSHLVDIFELLINTWIADLNLANKHYLYEVDGKITDKINSLFISDTILMYSYTAEIENFLKIVLLTQVLLANSFKMGVPLRGCITSGEITVKHLNNNDLIIGKPIVEAFLLEKKQEWAGCCVTKKCTETVERFHVNKSKPCLDWLIKKRDLLKYNVPLKESTFNEMLVINWVSIAKNLLKLESKDIYDSFFMHRKEPDNENEIIKTQNKIINTLKFWKENTT